MTTNPDEPPPTDGQEGRDPLKRVIAATLATFVVLGAFLAILNIEASINELNTARETTRTAVRAMRANVAVGTVLGAQAEQQAERDFLAFRRPLTVGAPSLTDAAGLPPQTARAVARDAARGALGLPEKSVTEPVAPLRLAAEYQSLRQQALATTRIAWNTRATQYTTVIAVLAAALFLVGFGLVVEGQIRRFTYGLGLVVGVVAIVWAAWLYRLPIPSTPDAAISAAAEGAAKTMGGDFKGAVAAYDRAVAAAPGYAAPYTGRARARLLAANPDYPVSRAFTDRDGRESEAAGRDARKGLELPGQHDVLAYAVAALEPFYRDDFAAALATTDQALELNTQITDLWLLKSASEAGLGDSAAAERSLAAALKQVRDEDPSGRARLLSSTYLSYLSYVAWARPHLVPETTRLANQVVARETAFTLDRPVTRVTPAAGGVKIVRLRYVANRLTFTLQWRNLPPRTALSLLGYELPLVNRAWSQPPDLALFATVRGSGERRISVPLKRVCRPAAVRADVFLNGAPVLVQVGPGVRPTC